MKFYLFIFLIAFVCISCKKDLKYTRVSGTVISIGSKKPIDSVLAILQDGVATDFLGTPANTSSDRKNYAYTDKNGYFDVELEGEHSAYIGFKKDKYIYKNTAGGVYIGIKSFSEGTHLNEVFEMQGHAYFNSIFVNKQNNKIDSLYIIEYYFYNDINKKIMIKQYAEKNDLLFFQPDNDNFPPGVDMIGDTYIVYEVHFLSNNQWLSKIDSVYIKSAETYSDTIYY